MQHQSIGIDIGKSQIHVSHPSSDDPKSWQVVVLDFKDQPDWHNQLLSMIADQAVVCLEPTGYHLSAPIANLILTYRPNASIYHVNHSTVGNVRSANIATAKTDHMDARALALIAHQLSNGGDLRGVRLYNPDLDHHVQALRSAVNNRRRIIKTTTRLKNRLHAFAHAVHPMLDIKFKTWLWLASQGIIDPHDITSYLLDLPDGINSKRLQYIKALHATLPAKLCAPPAVRDEILRTIDQLQTADDQLTDLEEQIKYLLFNPPFAEITRRLLTIPASSITRIAPFIVASNGLIEHMTPDQFKACIGANPLDNTSGTTGRTKISKKGYKPAREELYTWALGLVTPNAHDNPIRRYHERISKNNKWKPFTATKAKLANLISGVARSPEGYKFNV
jgi:transposase